MNDLAELKDAWGQPDPPTRTAYSTARAALLQQIAVSHTQAPAPKRPRRHGVRFGWLAGGTAVTAAAAAAVAFAVTAGTTQPGQSQPGQTAGRVSGQSSSQLSGQQILLAAATVAEAKPASSGTYWHVKTLDAVNGTVQTLELWITRDGKGYSLSKHDGGVLLMEPAGALSLGNAQTLAQLEQLPTDPAALKAWITDSYTHPSPPPSILGIPAGGIAQGDEISAADLPGMIAGTLTSLLYRVPVPPAVRAAAFRALASMPNVTNLGAREGGQALRISFPPPSADKYPNGKVPAGADHATVVIDPATSMLLSTTNYQGTIKILTAEWTNTMPKIVSVPHK